MATNDEIIGNKLGGILCQSDAHNDVSPDGQGYYISDGTVLVRYVSDVPQIREMLDTARADTIKLYPLMKKEEEEAIRADTEKQIFSEIDKLISYYTVSGEYSASGSIAHIQRSRYESLKEQHKVD